MGVRMITFTDPQRRLLESFAERLRNFPLSTEPADRGLAEQGIYRIYEQAGVEPPDTIKWFESPLAAAQYILSAQNRNLGRFIADRIPLRFASWAGGQLYRYVSNPIHAQVNNELEAAWAEVVPAFANKFKWLVNWSFPIEPVGFDVVLSLAQYEYFLNCGLPVSSDAQGISKVIWNCDCWWPFLRTAILVDRPSQIHWDSSWRLHSEEGAAIQYRDGSRLFFYHGVRVPPWVVQCADQISLGAIDEERNVEVRRVMIDRYKTGEELSGAARYIKDIKAEILDHDEQWGTLRFRHMQNDEPIVMLEVVNGSPEPDGTFKHYWLRVPPTISTALDAVAWTYGMSGKEYATLQERT